MRRSYWSKATTKAVGAQYTVDRIVNTLMDAIGKSIKCGKEEPGSSGEKTKVA